MTKLVITRKHRHRIVATAVVALLVSVLALNAAGSGSVTSQTSALPDESFALFDGDDTTFAEFNGQPLVVNFWASWCPACVGELPEFQAVHEQYGDDVTILGIANTDQRTASLKLAAEIGLTYQLGDDPNGDLFRSLELFAMPSTLFITSDGQVHEVFAGQLNEQGLAERIDALVDAS